MTLKRLTLLGSLLVGLSMLLGSALAQSNEVILTIAVEEMRGDMLNERVLQGFYDAHPGVKVVPVPITPDEIYHGFAIYNTDQILDQAEKVFSKGDVVMVREDYNFLPLITRAGYALDLNPYMRADSSGAVEDFYPVASKMFAWDNGVWALPAALYMHVLAYDPAAFEAAGYPLPDSSWTIDQYLDASDALTTRDANGQITQPGFMNFSDAMALRLMTGKGLYETTPEGEIPSFADPAVEADFLRLNAYGNELHQVLQNNPGTVPWDRDKAPLQMTGSWMIGIDMNGRTFMPAILSGEMAIVSGQGFAVSAGTQYPDLAYDLAMYLTGQPEVVQGFYGDSPARQSIVEQVGEEAVIMASDVFKAVMPQILENGIPWSEMRYAEYVDHATFKLREDSSLTPTEALRLAEEQALDNLKLAASRREETITVSTPLPTPQLAANEIAIKFVLQTHYATITNPEQWEQVEQEFVAADPEVGDVEITLALQDPRAEIQTTDCAYFAHNYAPSFDLSQIQPLDPYLATDTTFDRSDIPDVIWPQVTVNEQVYALPMTMVPLMMWYNPNDFDAVGIAHPQYGWTIADFMDALTHLREIGPEHKVYRSQTPMGNGYVMLAAALGGLAVDYSTPTPTFHLTDPAVIEAFTQLLDLAKQGYIEYSSLEEAGSGLILIDDRGFPPSLYERPGYIDDWTMVGTDFSPHLPVTFPGGTGMLPLSVDLGTGYISANTSHADACYRWLSTIAQHPELFTDMPARRSQATSDLLIASQGQQASDFYVGQFALLDSPQAVLFPYELSAMTFSNSIMLIWFHRALDAYVLENADLAQGLAEAQTKIDEYTRCIAPFTQPAFTMGPNPEMDTYYSELAKCAISVDPTMQEEVQMYVQ